MKSRLKKIAANNPVLGIPLLSLRRIWNDRWAVHHIAADLIRTYQEARFLRSNETSESGRTLLVFALDDESIYSLKQYALMATALRIEGWTILVVLRNRSMWLGKLYFKAFGITKFVYLEDEILTRAEREFCVDSATEFLQKPLSLQVVKSWYFKNSWIGSQIISTLSRLRFEGMPDFSKNEIRSLLEGMLPSVLEHVMRAEKFILHNPADLAITIEANYSFFGPLVDMAIQNKIDVIQMIQPWRDDALTFRRLTHETRRDHPSSVAIKTLDKVVEMPWSEKEEEELQKLFSDRYGGKWYLQARNQLNTHSFTRNELLNSFDLDPKKKIAVVFSHILWDANLFYGEDLFEDYGDWFVQTIKAACANSNLNWLIKIHPANVWKRAYENVTCEYAELALIRREIGELPEHVKIIDADSNVSTLTLFEQIDFGITVRGTSGMELVCFGKPCITAGTGRYSNLGFTVDSIDREQYLAQLSRLHELGPMTQSQLTRAKWHAYTSFILRPWSMKSAKAVFDYQKKGRHPLDHNLHMVVGSITDIEENGDLALWSNWVKQNNVDYVSPKHNPVCLEREAHD